MTYSFEIPFELPTLNEYVNAERTNKYIASSMKKKYTGLAALHASKLPKLEGMYDVEIEWYTKDNRKDSDNIFFGVKFVLDGLVSSNKLQTDGRKQIRHISHKIFTDKNVKIKVNLIKIEKI